MKTKLLLIASLLLFYKVSQAQVRKEINIPDIPGYVTLKGDFHMHSVFSDGRVWPTIRVFEAWRDGLDVIAITDHINYKLFKEDIYNIDENHSYELAKPTADMLGIILINGVEISYEVPPGHLNVLFIKDANLLMQDDIFKTFEEAKNQGAYIQWNHPGYKQTKPIKWFDILTQLHEKDLLDGIEVYTSKSYTPEALAWAQEKDLTMTANSDIHFLVDMYHAEMYQRPVTLVFAKDKSAGSVKEALLAGRTAAFFENTIVGKKEFLLQLFEASVKVLEFPLNTEDSICYVQIKNSSDLDFELELINPVKGTRIPGEITIWANRITMIKVKTSIRERTDLFLIKVRFNVKNLIVAPNESLEVELPFPGIESVGSLK